MPTLADSLVSSTARPLPMRVRPDLEVRRHRYQGRQFWVIKDPVGLTYFRFQEEEFVVLQSLDGKTSLDELKKRFEREFAPQKIGLDELGRLVGTLHRNNLLIADLPGQGPQLLKRRAQRTRQKVFGALSNILSIRFRGLDPERLLTAMLPYTRWFFTPAAATCCIVFALSALLLVTVQFDEFQSKLPTFHQFFAAKNWIYLGIAMAVTKVIHEFGHGLSCKYFGGECHEMGVMLLVFTPCLYCNVSDSWMLPSKWQRAFIGAAGMYVELVIASVATYIWWFSEPGMLNQLALSTMFVCSVSTVLFNANPLMRYDGYYILSDLTEIPNLRQKSTTLLSRKLGKWCLGLKEPDDPFLPQRNQLFFVAYSIAASVYMWIVTFSITWFLYHVAKGNGLQIFGQMLAVMAVVSLLMMPLYRLFRFFYLPGRIDQVKKPRLFATLAVLAGLAAAFALAPIPYHVYCPLEVKPANAETVYVEVPGILETVFVKPGERVEKGQVLAQLINLDLDMKIAEMIGKRENLSTRLDVLSRIRFDDSSANDEIQSVEKTLAAVETQLVKMEEDRRKLQLKAHVSGTILSPPRVAAQTHAEDNLPSWEGSPLDSKNAGAALAEGVVFCLIGQPTQMEAVLVIDQSEIDFTREGQSVEIKLDALPHDTFNSALGPVSPENMKIAPKGLSNKAGGDIETKTDETGQERPISTSYQAVAPLPDNGEIYVPGMRGRAKISAGEQTAARRLWRYLQRTFNFEL